MPLLIKDPEVDGLVRELARRTGESLTQAVGAAARERLARLSPAPERVDRAALADLLALLDALPRREAHLSDDELVGYDDDGLPR